MDRSKVNIITNYKNITESDDDEPDNKTTFYRNAANDDDTDEEEEKREDEEVLRYNMKIQEEFNKSREK